MFTRVVAKEPHPNEIKPLNGIGLKKHFEKHIGPDYLKYVESKLDYLSKLEREGQTKVFNWAFKTKNDINSMANCFLGYNEKFNIDVAEYDAPFGIEDKEPISTFLDYETTITPSNNDLKETKVCFKTSEFGKKYEFTGVSYTVPEELRAILKKARVKCTLFDFLFDHETISISLQVKNIFMEDIKVSFKELFTLFQFLQESISSEQTYITLVNSTNNKKAEICIGPPKFNLPNDFPLIFKSISATYKKFCELNIEQSEISTKYIWDHIGRFHLFSIIDKEYVPAYVLEFNSQGDNKPEIDAVIFKSLIELNDIDLFTFVAFYGTVERVRENVLLGRFNRSEHLGDMLLSRIDNRDDIVRANSISFAKQLTDKGFKVLQ